MTGFHTAVAAVLDGIGGSVWLHARDIDAGHEVGVREQEPMVLASVFKVPILVELQRQIAAGEIDPQSRLRSSAADRSGGPTGTSVLLDEVDMSVRDTAVSMMSVSDNAATDTILGMVGPKRVEKTMRDLGLASITLTQSCRDVYTRLAADLGAASSAELAATLADAEHRAQTMARAAHSSVLDPARTNAGSAADITRLLRLIWTDAAAPAAACGEMRRILGLQVWPHRLRAGFPEEVAVAGKTGTLPFVRNEAGVVRYLDGTRFAVAVFLRVDRPDFVFPQADAAIGTLARMAVDELRRSR